MNQSEEKSGLLIEPYSLIRDLVHSFWTVILAALIGYMGVSVYGRSIYRPEYTSTATLIANIRNSSSYSSYANISVSSEMAQMFTSILVQPSMTQRAAENLGYASFDGRVNAGIIDSTNIFTVSVTASSPEISYRELCSLLEVYPEISSAVISEDAVIDVMRSPDLPTSPSNSIPYRNRLKASLALAALDIVVVMLFSIFRDTVKDANSFRKKIDAELCAAVAHEKPHGSLKASLIDKKKTALLVNDSFASYRFVESYGKLATKIEYSKRTKGQKIILITSVAENEGKSTIAANVALSLAERGNQVALLDMDFKKPALHKIFDLKPTKFPDLGDLFSGRVQLNSYRLKQYQDTNLYLACNNYAHEDYVDWVHSERVGEIIASFGNGPFDYCIIDTPPLFAAADVPVIAKYADAAYVVVRTDCVPTADINDAVLSLSNECGKFVGCILNDLHPEFSFLGQIGADESGRYGAYSYAKYGSKKYKS